MNRAIADRFYSAFLVSQYPCIPGFLDFTILFLDLFITK